MPHAPRHLMAVCAVALSFGLGGCTPDVTDVSERVIITALGLDSAPNGGVLVTASFLSFQSALTSSSGDRAGSSDGASENVVIKSEMGQTVSDAFERLDGAIPGQTYFGSTRTLVIGAELARSGELLGAVQPLLRLPRLPRNESVTVVGDTAEAFLRSKTPAADSVSRHLRLLYSTARETDIAYSDPRVWQLYDALASGDTIPVPFVEATKEGPEVVGQAIFAQGRLRTVVERQDLPFLAAINWKGPVTITLGAMPGQTRPISLTFNEFHLQATLADDERSVRVTYQGTAVVASGGLRPQTGSSEAALDRFAGQKIADRTLQLLQRLYAQGIDVLHLADEVRARTGVTPSPSQFENLRFEIQSNINITSDTRGH